MPRTHAMAAVFAAVLIAKMPLAQARPRTDTVAILSVEITGDGEPELRSQIHRSLASGIRDAGKRVIKLSDVIATLRDSPELIGCTSTTCLRRIGTKLGARYFARARIEATGSAYLIEIELLAAYVEGGVITRAERSCPVCTLREINDIVNATAKHMVKRPRRRPKSVLIKSTPTGANIRVDERSVGVTPVQLKLLAGEHTIAAAKRGYNTTETVITVNESIHKQQEFDITLSTTPTSPVLSDSPYKRPYRTYKWLAAGSAGAFTAAGIALIALDGNRACDLEPNKRQCRQIYGTATLGIVNLGFAAALGGVSFWMFREDQARPPTLVPTQGGAAAFYSTTF